MKYINIIKWNLYAGIKRRVLNTAFLKSVQTKYAVCIYGMVIALRFVMAYLVTISIKKLTIVTGNDIIDYLVSDILGNSSIMMSIVIVYVLYSICYRINMVSKLTISNRYTEWLQSSSKLKEKNVLICILLSYNLLESSDLFTVLFPIFIGCYKNMGIPLLQSIIYGIFISVLLFFIGLLCSVWRYMWMGKEINACFRHRAVMNIVRILIISSIFAGIGSRFSTWMNKFPLVRKKVSVDEFSLWVDEIKYSMQNDFFAVENKIQNAISSMKIGHYAAFIVIVLMMLYVSGFYIGKTQKKKKYITRKSNNISFIRNKNYYLKAVFESIYLKDNIKYMFGTNMFWGVVGFYGGLMINVSEMKVLFFLSVACAFYIGLFYSQSLIRMLNVVYTLDGEGKKVCFWRENIIKLLDNKEMIWRGNIAAISIMEYLGLYICSGNAYIFLAGVLQIIYMSALFQVYNIPAVLFPHFEYKNSEELVKYLDREKVYDVIDGIMMLGVNVILAIPTALFMTDEFGIRKYLLIQFLLGAVVLIAFRYGIRFYIKTVISKDEFVQKIYLR